jgi:hypothetical protein
VAVQADPAPVGEHIDTETGEITQQKPAIDNHPDNNF